MNKGLLGKVSLFSVVLLAIALILIFVLPVFSVAFTPAVNPSDVSASSTNQILTFTIINTNATGNITQVNITIPAGFGFIAASNATTASDTTFSNSSALVIWSNATEAGFIVNGTSQNFSINVTVPSIASSAYYFNVSTSDTSGEYNSTNVTITVNDTTYPTWSSQSNATPSSYSSTPSQFNITWTDNVGMSKVFIEGNWSNSNVSMTNEYGGGIYNYSEVLPAGVWQWKSYANDTKGNMNSSSPVIIYIAQATPTMTLTNATVTYPTSTTINGSVVTGDAAGKYNISLYRNGSLINSSIALFSIIYTDTPAAAVYNYTLAYNGTQNYTFGIATNFTAVSQNSSNPVVLTINNGISLDDQNISITYGTSITVNCSNLYSNSGSCSLYRNDSLVTPNTTNETVTLGGGTYAYLVNTSGNTNYGPNATGETFYVTVSKASSPLVLSNNASWSETYPEASNTTVSGCPSEISSTCTLYRNDTGNLSTSEDDALLRVGAYNYTYNTSGNANYSSNSTSTILSVAKGTPNVRVYINGLITNQTVVYPAIATIKGNSSSGGVLPTFSLLIINATNSSQLFINNTTSSPIFISQLLGAGTYNITFNTSGNANWSEAINNTLNLTVSQNSTNPVNLVLYNGTNNTNQNVTAAYPTSVTIFGDMIYSQSGLALTYLDGSSISNPTSIVLSVGTHTVIVNTTGNTNYSSNTSGQSFNVTISKGTPNAQVFINENSANTTINYSASVTTIKGNSSSGGVLPALFNISITNVTNTTQPISISNTTNSSPIFLSPYIGYGTYRINLTYDGNSNWSYVSNNTTFLIVNKGSLSGSILGSNVTLPSTTSVTPSETNGGDSDVNYTFWRDTTLVSFANGTSPSAETQSTAGTYTYLLNSSGGANWTSNSSISTSVIIVTAASSSTTGGSSSIGGITSTGMVSYITLGVGKANITVNYLTTSGKLIANIARYQDVAFRGMNVTVLNNVVNIKIMISKLPSLPSSVSYDISGKVYNYISVGEQNFTDADIKLVNIYFAVNKTWLTNNNIDASNITLYRWANNKWNDLNAVKVSDNGNEVFFTASSPGLSVFIIGTKGGAPVITPTQPTTCTESWSCTDWSTCANNQQTRTCTDTNNCGTTTNKPSESQSCTVNMGETTVPSPTPVPTSMLTMVIVIAIAIIACVFIFLERANISSSLKKITKNNNNHKNLDILARKANKVEEKEEEMSSIRAD